MLLSFSLLGEIEEVLGSYLENIGFSVDRFAYLNSSKDNLLSYTIFIFTGLVSFFSGDFWLVSNSPLFIGDDSFFLASNVGITFSI
jgi:hypothetical protein